MLIPLPMSNQPHPDKFLRFNREISQGDGLYVLDAKPSEMVEADKRLVDQARERAGVEQSELAAILVFSCVGRFREHETDPISWEDAARSMCDDSPDVPLVGALCSGEFGSGRLARIKGKRSECFRLLPGQGLRQSSPERGDLQSKLLEWARSIGGLQVSPRSHEGRLLKELSKREPPAARSASWTTRSARFWERNTVGRSLLRDLNTIGREFSGARIGLFLRWSEGRSLRSFETGHFQCAMVLTWNGAIRAVLDEDILTLIVPNAQGCVTWLIRTMPDFSASNTYSVRRTWGLFLAIPLVGSGGKAIATMQLSLPDGELPDRDEFSSWIGYAQQVGAVLERAQETEERHIATSISAYGNELLQRPPVLEEGPHAWCDSFLSLSPLHCVGG